MSCKWTRMANLRYYIRPGRICRLFCVRELISTDVRRMSDIGNVYGMINSNRNQFPLLENPRPFHTQMNLITTFKNFVWNPDSASPYIDQLSSFYGPVGWCQKA